MMKSKKFLIPTQNPLQYTDCIIYGTLSNNQLNGNCRIHYFQGNVIQGCFQNGYSQNFIVYQPTGCTITGIWKNNNLNGYGVKYNIYGELSYAGNFVNGKKDGKGTQYFDGKQIDSISGIWVNDKKEGQFSYLCNGIVGNKKLIYKQDIIISQNDKQRQSFSKKIEKKPQTQFQSSFLQKYILNQTVIKQPIIQYGYIITNQMIVNLKNSYTMLNTSILSYWAKLLLLLLKKYKRQHKIHIFGTDLFQQYYGRSYHNYSNVKNKTLSFRNNFCLVKGYYQMIMFPIRLGFHFSLAVVRIIKKQKYLKFKFTYYDSLGYRPKSQNYLLYVIKQYLIAQLSDKIQQNDDSKYQIEKAINQMEIQKVQNTNLQHDGVSCGVFVCRYIQQLCLNKNLKNWTQDTNCYNYRKGMYQTILKNDNYRNRFTSAKVFQLKAYEYTKLDEQRKQNKKKIRIKSQEAKDIVVRFKKN